MCTNWITGEGKQRPYEKKHRSKWVEEGILSSVIPRPYNIWGMNISKQTGVAIGGEGGGGG